MKGPEMTTTETTTKLSIQTVSGLIRRTPGIQKSHKYTQANSRSVRSNGVYVYKNYQSEIVVGFEHGGYKHLIDIAGEQLHRFQNFATGLGFEFTPVQGTRFELVIKKVA